MATAQAQSKSGKSRQPARAKERESDAEELSGERDEHYNLVSVLYHGLQGADQAALYAEDAEEAGDEELAEFFRSIGLQQGEFAQQAKQLLVARVGGTSGGRSRSGRAAARTEDDDEEEDEGDDD